MHDTAVRETSMRSTRPVELFLIVWTIEWFDRLALPVHATM